MKKLNLLALIFLIGIGKGFSQSSEKTKHYSIMGKTWSVTKHQDGTKSYEWEIQDQDFSHHKEKSSKFKFDFLESEVGFNVWPMDKGAPEVKPWGSWFVSVHSVGTWKPSKNFNLRSTLGVSWYNFKFEDPSLVAIKSPQGLEFLEYTNVINAAGADPIKSKISASYATLTLVPTLLTNNGKMRIGAGAYAGFRLGGRGKFVYEVNDDRRKDFTKSNMYAENLRFGLRGEVGIGDVTLFYNHDLNNLFQAGKGPELQAMSFGIRID
jgi:hypothetical protein